MPKPDVSIVIDNYNYEAFLAAAIESALAQTAVDAEVIVVDDGSTDGSCDIIRSYDLRPILKDHGGQASAFNAALPACRADVVCFLDADDMLLPDAAATFLPLFADRSVAKVSWPLWRIDAEGRGDGRTIPEEELPSGDLAGLVSELGPDSYLSSPCSGNAWSRSFLEQVLPIPRADFRNGADGYLITVAPLYGTVERVPEPLGSYRIHGRNHFWAATVEERTSGALARYEHRARVLLEHLGRRGIPADPAAWRERNPYVEWLRRTDAVVRAVKAVIPPGAEFVLIDGDCWGTGMVTGRRARPFPEVDGLYGGPPADDNAADEALDRARHDGVGHVVVGWPAFWWLEHYPRFFETLRREGSAVVEDRNVMIIELSDGGTAGPR